MRYTHNSICIEFSNHSQYFQVCCSAPGYLPGCTSVQLMVLSVSCLKQVTSGKMCECADFLFHRLQNVIPFERLNISWNDFVLVYCIGISHMCSHTTARHGNAIQPTTTCASDCDQRSKPRFTEAWPHVVCRIQSEVNHWSVGSWTLRFLDKCVKLLLKPNRSRLIS